MSEDPVTRMLMEACRLTPQEMWEIQQEAMKAYSLTEDVPLSQTGKADQWKS